MKNFALIGAAGYIAPRHLAAIKATGHNLVAALDPHDSVGILDRYFPEAAFFTQFERFDRHLEKLRRGANAETTRAHYVSICSPNYLHDAHVRLALRIGADAICEKPVVIKPWNIDALMDIEQEFNKRVYTVLQLRHHPQLINLQKQLKSHKHQKHQVKLEYITRRGQWYHHSWKGVPELSGGIAMNIGIHFFDLLIWLFGEVESFKVTLRQSDKIAGELALESADVKWFLSIDGKDLPEGSLAAGKPAYRHLTIDGENIEFSDGFTDLHTRVYQDILNGKGCGLKDTRAAIELVYNINQSEVKT